MFISSPNTNENLSKTKKKIIFLKLGEPTRIDHALTYFHQLWKIKAYIVLKESCLFGSLIFFIFEKFCMFSIFSEIFKSIQPKIIRKGIRKMLLEKALKQCIWMRVLERLSDNAFCRGFWKKALEQCIQLRLSEKGSRTMHSTEAFRKGS